MHFPSALPVIALLALVAPSVLAYPDEQVVFNSNARALSTTDDLETVSARSLAVALLDEIEARGALPGEVYDELVARGKQGGKHKGGKGKGKGKGKGPKGKGKGKRKGKGKGKGKGRKGKGHSRSRKAKGQKGKGKH